MTVKNKWTAILLLISGVMVAGSNAYLFLTEHGAWQGVMIIVGIYWLWVGATNVRRMQNEEPK
jgi:hypothetical protein